MDEKTILGIDIGGTGMKGAIVDITTGELLTERLKIPTPQPATPKAMTKVFKQLVDEIGWNGEIIGCGFPAIVKKGVAKSAANIHSEWINKNIVKLFQNITSREVHALNDADAAGLAEVRMGAGKGRSGTILMITIGTGLGSALYTNGQLVPNTELGHFKMHGKVAEHYAANSIRKKYDLSWEEWGGRLSEYLHHLERLFSPDLFILGGGVCKKMEFFRKHLTVETPIKKAVFQNNAGIVGAALYASEQSLVKLP
jgi:polyphosphate glucokinase